MANSEILQSFVYVNRLSSINPPSIFSLSYITTIDVAVNQIQGNLPADIGITLPNLQVLGISKNYFTGTIPVSISNASNLEHLETAANEFTGEVPSLEKLQRLQWFLIGGNHLGSEGAAKDLSFLCSLTNANSLEAVDLGLNNFGGTLSECINNFTTSLSLLSFEANQISGSIPTWIGNLINLEILSMQGNQFSGHIPPSIGRLWKLQLLYLTEFQLPICNFQTSKKRRLTLTLKLIISIISGLLGVFLVLSLLLFFWFKKKRKKPLSTNYEKSFLKVSYQNLVKGTDGLSSANLIGMGSFGSVYKGILEQDEMIIAIKVFNILHRRASKSVATECEALRNIKHRNLIKMMTACTGVDYYGNDFKALIYEFMDNGSLEDWLHPTYVGINEADKAPRSLNLLQRLNIVIDIACALEYLHHHCETPIVHCDLKPSNVLLDDEMIGHISDFGLAKLLADGNQNYSTNQSSSIGLRGAISYAPPEYGVGSEVSTYGDMYSYGILLLEMFTGKRPIDDMFKERLSLRNFVKVALPERVAEIAAPILLQERAEVEMNRNNTHNVSTMRKSSTLQYLISILGIGISCSVELPRERMNISDVNAQLYSIKVKLLETLLARQRQTRSTLQSAVAGA